MKLSPIRISRIYRMLPNISVISWFNFVGLRCRLTQPTSFLRLGNSLEECAKKYKGFCQKYKPKEKNPSQCHWGSKLLAGVHLTNQGSTTNPKKSKSGFPPPPCQVSETPELTEVVRQFIEANRAPRDVETDFWPFLRWVVEWGDLLRVVARKRIP